MLGFVSRFVGEGGSAPDEPDDIDGRGGSPPTRLYECPDCESVYLSEDLATCRSCDTSVDPIPSEHDLGYGSGGVGDG